MPDYIMGRSLKKIYSFSQLLVCPSEYKQAAKTNIMREVDPDVSSIHFLYNNKWELRSRWQERGSKKQSPTHARMGEIHGLS